MKLNYKRTILVGFAFFLISAFWQAYDNAIPLTLINKFGMNQTWSGVIMAIDNVLAVFLLPLFGALSDKRNTRIGRRTPFILVGTLLAAAALIGLTFVDSAQLRNISAAATIDDPAALEVIYDSQADNTLLTPEGESFVLSEVYTREEFSAITSQITDDQGKKHTNADYTAYVIPARQAYAAQTTRENPSALYAFIGLLLVVLLSMSLFRSPAVALMPDVTLKPLRSKANAIINLMGTAGGMLVLGLGIVVGTSSVKNSLMPYSGYFGSVVGIMLIALLVFLLTVKEKKWAEEMRSESVRLGIEEQTESNEQTRRLSKAEVRSLLFILASVALWYFGYNAVTTKYSVYASNVLHKDYNTTMLIAQGAAIISYLPAGMLASKIGRRKTILGGVILLAAAFGCASFMRAESPTIVMNVLFAMAGIGWATINVNSFPMVVEMSSGGDIGKYTGFYYTASMSAQILTPMVSGFIMDKLGMPVLFPYAAIFVALAFITMLLVRHGDSKVAAKTGLEAFDTDD